MSSHQPGFPVSWKRWFATVFLGNIASTIEMIIFDVVVYGAVSSQYLDRLGLPWAAYATFATMAPISFVMCLLYMKAYDWSGQDWLGYEVAKEVRDSLEEKGPITKLVRRVVMTGDLPAFFALSFWGDPFRTTAYLRKAENRYRGLSSRDWRIFLASVLVSNGLWTLVWIMGWQIPSFAEFVIGFLPLSWQEQIYAFGDFVTQAIQPVWQWGTSRLDDLRHTFA